MAGKGAVIAIVVVIVIVAVVAIVLTNSSLLKSLTSGLNHITSITNGTKLVSGPDGITYLSAAGWESISLPTNVTPPGCYIALVPTSLGSASIASLKNNSGISPTAAVFFLYNRTNSTNLAELEGFCTTQYSSLLPENMSVSCSNVTLAGYNGTEVVFNATHATQINRARSPLLLAFSRGGGYTFVLEAFGNTTYTNQVDTEFDNVLAHVKVVPSCG